MKVRRLEPHEHGCLAGLGPFDGVPVPDPDYSTVVVAESPEGEILGFWCASSVVHAEPLWVAPKARDQHVGTALWAQLFEELTKAEVPCVFAIVKDENVETHLPMATKAGFEKIEGVVLFADLRWILSQVLEATSSERKV